MFCPNRSIGLFGYLSSVLGLVFVASANSFTSPNRRIIINIQLKIAIHVVLLCTRRVITQIKSFKIDQNTNTNISAYECLARVDLELVKIYRKCIVSYFIYYIIIISLSLQTYY